MTWTKLDEGFVDHPKINRLSDGAFRLHVSGMVTASRLLSNGFIETDRAPRLVPRFKRAHITELEQVGVWEPVRGGWLIHDFLLYNPSAAQVK